MYHATRPVKVHDTLLGRKSFNTLCINRQITYSILFFRHLNFETIHTLKTFYLIFQALELCYVTVEVATIGEDSLGDKVVR